MHKIVPKKSTNPSVDMDIPAYRQKLYQDFLSRKSWKKNHNYGTCANRVK
jgi:hypothetical protein